jgi:hypothetical protein
VVQMMLLVTSKPLTLQNFLSPLVYLFLPSLMLNVLILVDVFFVFYSLLQQLAKYSNQFYFIAKKNMRHTTSS